MNKRPKNCLTCGKPKMPYGGGPLTSSGAKEMLRDNSAHGHKLTPKQKRYFGYIAGGGKPKKQAGGAIDINKFRRNTMIPGQDIPYGDPAMQYGNIQIPHQHDTFKPGVDIPYKDPAMEGYKPEDRLQEAISKGIFQGPKDFTSAAAWYDYMTTPAPKGIPKKPNPFALRVGYEGALTGLNAIAGGVERSRQNQYKESQYASLGQEDPIPVSNYQQNPYSLYSRYGGRIKKLKHKVINMGDPDDDGDEYQDGGLTRGLIPTPSYYSMPMGMGESKQQDSEYYRYLISQYQMLGPEQYSKQFTQPFIDPRDTANSSYYRKVWERNNKARNDAQNVMTPEQIQDELHRSLYAPKDVTKPIKKKGGHWIQGAINPKHKGYCTPLTKSTCTGRRRALALTFKKHHGFHKKK